jgi:hypothetical protein
MIKKPVGIRKKELRMKKGLLLNAEKKSNF